jgi:hypothetical protein
MAKHRMISCSSTSTVVKMRDEKSYIAVEFKYPRSRILNEPGRMPERMRRKDDANLWAEEVE